MPGARVDNRADKFPRAHVRAARRRARRAVSICLLLVAFSLTLVTPPPAHVQTQSRPRKVSGDARPSATPEQQGQSQAVDDDEVVKVDSSEVLLPVTVRDAMGGLVRELTKNDFRVWEDERPQPLSDLSLRRVPVDVLLMVDASSSVAASFEDFRRAAEQFAARLAPEDRFGLLKFDDKVELLLDWTQSRAQLRRALARVAPGVFTRFNDALYLAAREQFRKGQRRHAAIVLSDGIDSGRGHASLENSLRALLESQVTVYVISNTRIERARKRAELDSILAGTPSTIRFNELKIGDLREGLRVLDQSEHNLGQLASATGGRLYRPDDFNALEGIYAEVAEELRHQYALYYTPLNTTRDGSFRRVRVEMTNPAHRATTRVGYFAPRK